MTDYTTGTAAELAEKFIAAELDPQFAKRVEARVKDNDLVWRFDPMVDGVIGLTERDNPSMAYAVVYLPDSDRRFGDFECDEGYFFG